jgi:hypothetical protein
MPEWTTPRAGMIDFLMLLRDCSSECSVRTSLAKPRGRFSASSLIVLKGSAPVRLRLRQADRLIFVWLYQLAPTLVAAAAIFKPERWCATAGAASVSTGAGSLAVVSAGLWCLPTSAI